MMKDKPEFFSKDGVLFDDQEGSEDMPKSKNFEQLAMLLIVSVKSLMQYCDQQVKGEKDIQLRDKDIEKRVKVVNDILEMGSDISQ